jgi:hypothetical protein
MVGSAVAGTPVISSDGQRIFLTRNSVPLPDPPTNAPVSSVPSTRPSSTPSSGPVAIAPVVAPIVAPLINNTTNTTNTTTTTTTTNETATGGRTLQNDATPPSVATVAHFTVLNAEDGSMVRNDPSTSLLLTNHKYAPVGLARNVTNLLFSDGIVSANIASDLIVWHGAGDAMIDGGGDTQLYQYVSPNITDIVPAKQLNSASWTTHGPPIVTNTGELFFLTTDGIVRGWTDGRNFDLTPNFQVAVGSGTTGGTTGNTTTATFTDAPLYVNGLLYVTVANSAVVAVSVKSSNVAWDFKSKSGNAVILARPVLSPDYQRLYVAIGSEIYVVNAVTGANGGNAAPYWTTPFGNEDGSLIVADPTVSLDGRFVYYVGIQRQIVTALKVGRSLEPTEQPSVRPSLAPSSSRAPSPPPVPAPVRPPRSPGAAAGEDIEEDKKKSGGANVPVLAGSIGGGLGAVLLLGLAYYIYRKRKGGGGGDDGIDPDYRYDYGGGSGRS